MLFVHQVSKSYGIHTVLDRVTFSLTPGERMGLVGENGSGKTTLLRIITGQEKPDSGSVQLTPPGLRLGYLPQGLACAEDETVGGYLSAALGDTELLGERLAELAAALADSPDHSALQEEYDRTLAQLVSASENAGQSAAILAGLGLDSIDRATPVAHLSGGQKTRLALAGVLLSQPQVLLLDEPTNHLDIGMLEWLEGWLASYPGALLIVSHDRAFLDHTVSGILELDSATHQVKAYPGSYSAYVEAKSAEMERQRQAYQDQQDEIARLKAAAAHMRSLSRFHKGGKTDKSTGVDGFSVGFFSDRGKETVQKAKNIEKRLERLLTEERIDKPRQGWQMKMEFEGLEETGRDVLSLENLSVGYTQGEPLLANLSQVLRYGARAVLIGPNGCGKTTLLRTIAGRIPPLAGQVRLGSRVQLGYMAQEQESLPPDSTPLAELQRASALPETEARAFLHKYLFQGDDVFKPVGRLSYGERARLTLACLVAGGCNFLLLDEPINHLDIPSRTRFEQALHSFTGTVLAVVHDRYFVQSFASEIWEVRDGGLLISRQS